MYQSKYLPKDAITYLTSTIADGSLMTLRNDDPDIAIENRQRFFEHHGIDPNRVISGYQTHCTGTHIATEADGGRGSLELATRIPDTDALITRKKNLFLLVTIADCAPIAYYDPKHDVIALSHNGWKGTDLRLAEKVVQTLTDCFETNPSDLIINIGPCIHAESYIHPIECLTRDVEDTWGEFIEKRDNDTYTMNTIGFNVDQLTNVGVPEEQIEIAPIDTYTSHEYFSFKRHKDTDEPDGRFVVMLGLVT